MKYPVLGDYLILEKTDDDLYDRLVSNITGTRLTAKKEFCRFAAQLDGKTDPYSLGYPPEIVEIYLDLLEENGLLKNKRLTREGLTSLFALSFHKKCSFDTRCRHFIYTSALALTFIPVLVLGIIMLRMNMSKIWYADYPIELMYAGWVVGLIFGMILHEFGHYSSTLAFGGEVFETGFGWSVIFPLAYVINDVSMIRNRLFRMQINAAGVESNFWLCGAFCCFAAVPSVLSWAFIGAAFANGMVGLINSLPISLLFLELDGAHILQDATNKNIIRQCVRNVFIRKDRRRILKSKVGGLKLAGSVLITCIQAVVPCYYIFVFVSIISLIRDTVC